jgi:hypothetical protein
MMGSWLQGAHGTIEVELAPVSHSHANFVKCSQEVKENGMYMPVACLSTSYSFVYVLTGLESNVMDNLEPSCGYLAMTPLGLGEETRVTATLENGSYADVVKYMTHGFSIQFPFRIRGGSMGCMMRQNLMP